jgi:hypothetical protein
MTRHALRVACPGKSSIHIKLGLEDVMANYSSHDSSENKVRLEQEVQAETSGESRTLTLYVMNTSMRKKETKTVAPYKPARKIREANGTVDLRRA